MTYPLCGLTLTDTTDNLSKMCSTKLTYFLHVNFCTINHTQAYRGRIFPQYFHKFSWPGIELASSRWGSRHFDHAANLTCSWLSSCFRCYNKLYDRALLTIHSHMNASEMDSYSNKKYLTGIFVRYCIGWPDIMSSLARKLFLNDSLQCTSFIQNGKILCEKKASQLYLAN